MTNDTNTSLIKGISPHVIISILVVFITVAGNLGLFAFYYGGLSTEVSRNTKDIAAIKASMSPYQVRQNSESIKSIKKSQSEISNLSKQVSLLRQEIKYDEKILHNIAKKVGADGEG